VEGLVDPALVVVAVIVPALDGKLFEKAVHADLARWFCRAPLRGKGVTAC
jgi:hypothetical protein